MSDATAAILAIGDELILGERLDTNSAWLAQQLTACGLAVCQHRTVPDDRAIIAEALGVLSSDAALVICTGGLGPTEDDLTRQALGDLSDPGAALVVDESAMTRLERWFAGRRRPMPERNRIQAMHPPSAALLPNAQGTAPGLRATVNGARIFALPGPPREMQPMFQAEVWPVACGLGGGRLWTVQVHSAGLGESDAADRLGVMLARDHRPQVGITASHGVVTARVRGPGGGERPSDLVSATADAIAAAWGRMSLVVTRRRSPRRSSSDCATWVAH